MSKTKKMNPKAKARVNPNPAKAGRVHITPLGDRVVLKPLGAEDLGAKTASGIIIPETIDKEKPEQGEVVAVGEGWYQNGKLMPMNVKVGDRVMFSKYGYDEIKIDGEDYFVLKQDSILAILN